MQSTMHLVASAARGIKALEGGAIRGAAAGIGILSAQAAAAASNFSLFGNSLDFLQGPIGQTVQAIADLTGQWGLAAVAAAAFAPMLPDIGKGAVKGLEGIGRLGKGLADLTGISERAGLGLEKLQNVAKSLNKGPVNRLLNLPAEGLFALGPNDKGGLNFPDLQGQAKAAASNFDSKMTLTALPEVMKAFNAQLQAAFNKLEANRRITQGWVAALKEGAEAIKQMKLENATQDLARSMRELNTLNEQRAKQARDEAAYYGTANTNLQEAIRKTRELTGLRATQPALRPAGMTDAGVAAFNETNQFMNAARPFAPGSTPGMTPDLIKKMNDEALRQQSITNKVKQSWAEAGQFAAKYRREIAEAAKTNALNLKATQTSILNSKLRLEYFKKQNAELEKQKGLLALIARQVAKGMDMGGPEGLKQGKQKFGENLALGVGFPLLFGGGPGSVIGSGIGSLFGEGFGGQILGGAIGQILDQAVAAAQALGNALGSINIDTLLEQGIALTGELQQQVELLKASGQSGAAQELLGAEFGKQTGDFGGKQAELAAGSVNELSKAWNGVVNSLRIAVGTLLSPFIQALTAILRLVQLIVVAWNSIVGLAGKLTTGFLNLIGIKTDEWYEKTRKNTAEYEKQVAAVKELAREIDKSTEIEKFKTGIDDNKTGFALQRTNGVTQFDKEYNSRLQYESQIEDMVQKRFDLEIAKGEEIAKANKEFAGLDEEDRKAAIDAIEKKYMVMLKRITNERKRLDKDYQLTVEQQLNQRAQLELKQAEAAQQLRRRAVSLDRGAEDLRLDAERTILTLRRQGAAIEKSAAELRMSIEDRIYDKRVEIQQMQLDISRRREQLAINEADLAAQAAKQFTGAIGEDLGNQLLDSTRQVVKVKAEGEADIQKKELELAIKIDQIDRDTKKFELEVAKKIEQIKQAAADYELAAAAAELKLARKAEDLKVAAADYAVAKRKEEIALMEEAAARIATSQLAQQIGGAYTNTAKTGSSSQVKALTEAANELGISAKDLAAIISYETAGTFSPSVRGGHGGNYEGLIQFGPAERKAYGVKPGMSFEDQITGPVVAYFKDRFAKVGRSTQGATLSDLYRTVNGGNPNVSLNASDGNGTLAEHIQNISKNHGAAAERFLGGDVEITRAVKDGVVEGVQESQNSAAVEATRPETAAAKSKVDAAVKAAEEARSQIQPSVAVDTNVDGLLEKNRQLAEQKKEVLRLEADTSAQEAKQRYRQQELADLQKTQQLILATKQPILEMIQQQQVAAEMRQRETQLLAEGMLPAQVQQTLEIEKQVNLQLQKIDGAIAIVEARVAELNAQENQTEAVKAEVALLEQKLGLLRAAKGEIQATGQAAAAGAADANSPANRLQGEVNKTQGELAKLQDPINLVVGAAGAMGDAFSEAFKGIVTGSMTAQEAFGAMAQKMADYFINMAMDMLAQYVKLIIMQTVLNALGGPSLGGGSAPSAPGPINGTQNYGGLGLINTGMQQAATGGRATGGEPIIVGERGPEVFTPDNAGSIGSNRYFDAARDSMSHDADTAANNVTEQRDNNFYEAMQSPEGREMKVSYDATVINEVEYVTADQFQRGMKDTATRARAETLKDLRNYPGKRAAVGMR